MKAKNVTESDNADASDNVTETNNSAIFLHKSTGYLSKTERRMVMSMCTHHRDDYKYYVNRRTSRIPAVIMSWLVFGLVLLAYSCPMRPHAEANIKAAPRECKTCHTCPDPVIKSIAAYKSFHQQKTAADRALAVKMATDSELAEFIVKSRALNTYKHDFAAL